MIHWEPAVNASLTSNYQRAKINLARAWGASQGPGGLFGVLNFWELVLRTGRVSWALAEAWCPLWRDQSRKGSGVAVWLFRSG